MEITTKEQVFLEKPKSLSLAKLSNKPLWTNLFSIKLLSSFTFYTYVVRYTPDVDIIRMKRIIFSSIEKEIIKVYGQNKIFTGDNLFSTVEVKDLKDFVTKLRNGVEYRITITKTEETINISKYNPLQNQAIKRISEEILKTILRANPKLEMSKDFFVKIDEKKTIYEKVDFYPGFLNSIHYLSQGIFTSISIKNRMLSVKNCFLIIKDREADGAKNKLRRDEIQIEINSHFEGRAVKMTYKGKKTYTVNKVNFNKNPKNTTFLYQGSNVTLLNYYKSSYGVDIKNTDQPLFESEVKGSDGKPMTIYLVPELCLLAGIDDSMIANRDFMSELAQETKFIPKDCIAKIESGKTLFYEKTKKKDAPESSFDLCKKFDVKIDNAMEPKGSYLPLASLIAAGKNVNVEQNGEVRFKQAAHSVFEFSNWLFVYHQKSYDAAGNFLENLKKAMSTFKIKVLDPEWAEVNSFNAKDWISTIESFSPEKKSFVLFFLDGPTDKLYKEIKIHSLCKKGYITQGVKSYTSKKGLSIASKVGLQINAKLGGSTYIVDFPKEIKTSNLMIVGVDSSHIKGKRTGISMTASYDSGFTQYYNSCYIIDEKNKEQLTYAVSAFLEEAIPHFFKKNKKTPGGIVIYRQGVSKEQKEVLWDEIFNIDKLLNGKGKLKMLEKMPIPYYYVLVNKKTTLKFFEKTRQGNNMTYSNPASGFVICDQVTDDNIFEFYMQPQVVTQGTATPTNYHVAYGNLNLERPLLDLTYGLCFEYANWQGPVRVPAPLKLAEKLSKMTAKVIVQSLSNSVLDKLCYL